MFCTRFCSWPVLALLYSCLSLMAAGLTACAFPEPVVQQLQGQAQGTTYAITYYGPAAPNYQHAVDSMLEEIDASLSTYRPGSTISRFNEGEVLESDDPHFFRMLEQSQAIYELTQGAFDPTVMPLVKAWGFGPDNRLQPQTDKLDSLRALVGFDKLRYAQPDEGGHYLLQKEVPGLQLDFNAIAQGYTVDVIADFLQAHSISHYLVELGGEVRAKGLNPQGKVWKLGIEKPDDLQIMGIQLFAARVALKDGALATSGNYRKFYLKDGIKYSHTIDPFTGRPVQHSLLSVTVMAPQAARADAFATAFMVMGVSRAKALIQAHPELQLEALFISGQSGGGLAAEATPGMLAAMKLAGEQ